MPYEPAEPSNRPGPRSPERQAEWEETARRHRMLKGKWRMDAEHGLRGFFDKSTHDFLPPAVLAFNPAKSYAEQTATLYDDEVQLHFDGRKPSKDALKRLGLTLLWAQMQDVLLKVRALKDCYIVRSWDERHKRVRYRVVTPDCIDADPGPEDAQQPLYVRELRRRRGIQLEGFDPAKRYWCWDEWSYSYDLAGRPVAQFRIVHESSDTLVDVTAGIRPELVTVYDEDGLLLREGPPGQWPYWSGGQPGQGDPIWPWTAYHERVSDELHSPYDGIELVDGTVIVAVLWTFWVGGYRDASFLQRWMMDARLAGVKNHDGQDYVAGNPLAVMQLRSTSADRPGTAGQWSAPVDPKSSGEAVASFAAMLALFAGLSPADVSVGSTGLSRTSGFAIEVSRDGKRKIERRLLVPMRLGDQHNLAHAAQLANAYGGGAGKLPEEPDAYQPVYTRQGWTTDEIRAQVERVRTLVGEGLMHPAEALQELRPELEREQAERLAIEIAEFKAFLETAAAAARQAAGEPDAEVEADETPTDETPTAETADTEPVDAANADKLQDTALNGAQVQAAQGIVLAVGAGQLPKATAEIMLAEFFNLAPDTVSKMLSAVVEGSTAPEQAPPPPASTEEQTDGASSA